MQEKTEKIDVPISEVEISKVSEKIINVDANTRLRNSKDLLLESNKLTTDDFIRILFTLAIKLKNNLSYTAALHFAQALNVFTDGSSRACSKYYWIQICNEYSQAVTTHSVCINCGDYLGVSTKKNLKCNKCSLNMKCESSDRSFL